tara:strand:+ start:2702 stop:3214 length:513 start_codon:yes stop_codon:yes gene_type:complete
MIILGLGSNLTSNKGNRFKNIDLAISLLEQYQFKILKKSSYFETPSYPDSNNPKFINIVAAVESNLPPTDLASVLIFVEQKLGRVRSVKNAPRTIDIDIIDYNKKVLDFSYNNLKFTVPHLELSNRNFVLMPLYEIIPDWIHPKTNENIKTLIQDLSEDDRKSILKVKKN